MIKTIDLVGSKRRNKIHRETFSTPVTGKTPPRFSAMICAGNPYYFNAGATRADHYKHLP